VIKKIAPDKWKHFFVGIAMGAVLQVLLWYMLTAQPVLATVVTLVLVMAISYGFELFSLITGLGHYDVMDAVAGTVGGMVGMALILVFVSGGII
jgi:glycopeptide antibiotics resistance protein